MTCMPSSLLPPPPPSLLVQVLVPLLLLQALLREGQSLTALLHLGVHYLEEDEAGFILQQGGWVSAFHTCSRGGLMYCILTHPNV